MWAETLQNVCMDTLKSVFQPGNLRLDVVVPSTRAEGRKERLHLLTRRAAREHFFFSSRVQHACTIKQQPHFRVERPIEAACKREGKEPCTEKKMRVE